MGLCISKQVITMPHVDSDGGLVQMTVYNPSKETRAFAKEQKKQLKDNITKEEFKEYKKGNFVQL
jgi:hypothetical protein